MEISDETASLLINRFLESELGSEKKNNEDIVLKRYKNKTVLVRTKSAGVFYGELLDKDGKQVILKDARMVWHWKGAFTVSTLALKGVSNPHECNFPPKVAEKALEEAIQTIPMTKEAIASLDSVDNHQI